MKIIVSLLGATATAFICFVVFSLVSRYQINQLNYIPSQSDDLTDLFIIVTPIVAVFGGWLSVFLYEKYLTNAIEKGT